jgi:mono/diheme cytochrome c family protein
MVPLVLLAASPAWGQEKGKEIFLRRGCAECHSTQGPEAKQPVPERHRIKGPTLWYAGSKFQPGYLKGWLAKPRALLGVKWGTMDKGKTSHPALPPAEAREVALYLESLKDPEMPAGVVPDWGEKVPRQVLRRARILFQKEQPCYACHMVHIRKTVYRQPVEVGGFTGPHLIDAGARLRPDFIVAFLKSPERYDPNGRMPRYGDKAFTPLAEQDIIALAAYIATFK